MKALYTTLFLLGSALTAGAQTQLVRGDVDTIQGTNQFRLDCTTIRLVSNTVNLQQLHDTSRQQDIEYEMQVTDVSVPGQTILNVVSAVAIPEIFGMGNLRFGRSETWELFAAPNSPAAIFVNTIGNTSYLPLGAAGTWLAGTNATLFRTGSTNGFGRWQFEFTMPSDPSFVGLELMAQAVAVENGTLLITNPDCKDVRSN